MAVGEPAVHLPGCIFLIYFCTCKVDVNIVSIMGSFWYNLLNLATWLFFCFLFGRVISDIVPYASKHLLNIPFTSPKAWFLGVPNSHRTPPAMIGGFWMSRGCFCLYVGLYHPISSQKSRKNGKKSPSFGIKSGSHVGELMV